MVRDRQKIASQSDLRAQAPLSIARGAGNRFLPDLVMSCRRRLKDTHAKISSFLTQSSLTLLSLSAQEDLMSIHAGVGEDAPSPRKRPASKPKTKVGVLTALPNKISQDPP